MMIDLLVKPAGIRCRQTQRPTKLHQIIQNLTQLIAYAGTTQIQSTNFTNSLMMFGSAGANMHSCTKHPRLMRLVE